MMTPHDTAQYGHVLRVSVVRAILNSRISARALFRSNPSAAPPPTTAPSLKKVRRFTGHLQRFEHEVTVPHGLSSSCNERHRRKSRDILVSGTTQCAARAPA